MQEIEVKILEIDVQAVVAKLESLGAEKRFDGEIDVLIYDSALAPVHGLFRLRTVGDKVELCFKKKVKNKNAKESIETEVLVSDFARMQQIIAELGYTVKYRRQKHRISYALGDLHFEIDTLQGIPPYLEVEAQSMERLQEAVAMLGFSMQQTTRYDMEDVEEHYAKKYSR